MENLQILEGPPILLERKYCGKADLTTLGPAPPWDSTGGGSWCIPSHCPNHESSNISKCLKIVLEGIVQERIGTCPYRVRIVAVCLSYLRLVDGIFCSGMSLCPPEQLSARSGCTVAFLVLGSVFFFFFKVMEDVVCGASQSPWLCHGLKW